MSHLSRRDFLKAAGVTTGAAFLAPSARVLGANDDVRVAILGLGGKGSAHTKEFHAMEGVRVVAVCDPDKALVDRRVADFEKQFPGEKVTGETDFRKVLESKEVDAVVIATCNHWHSLLTIYACQAGKDVYVEKPVSHTIVEGRRTVEAARKYQRIVQAGTQSRSCTGLKEFMPFLQEGGLGKVQMIRGLVYRDRSSIGKRDTPLTPPTTVDYNLWLGPAQDLPMLRPRFHYDWHYIWNTGGGEIGNQGPHQTDMVCWALGDKAPLKRILSFGGRFAWGDAGETPNLQYIICEYGDTPVIFEVRTLWVSPTQKTLPNYRGLRTGFVVTGEKGTFVGCNGGWIHDDKGERVRQFKGDGGGSHAANFIAAMRSRKESDLNGQIENSHKACIPVHAANISYRLGKQIGPDALRERLSADKEALEAIGRYTEQLAAWNVDVTKDPWTLGAPLEFDAEKERFTGTTLVAEANAMLHRQDRAPFIVPEAGKV